ncbi:MAG: Holliday junction branch migration protein RuvA [bacterium]
MIAQLQGILVVKEPTRVVVDVGGLGLELKVPLSTSYELPGCNEEVKLLVVTEITRAGLNLYGFASQREKEVFELLTGVRGVGPKAALNLLSRWSPDEITSAINQGKTDLLRSAPGIGPKKVDALLKRFREQAPSTEKPTNRCISPTVVDALNALVSLGLSRKEAQERLAKLEVTPETTLQEILKLALAMKV